MTVVFNQFLNLMLDENLYQAGTSCAGTDANKAVCHHALHGSTSFEIEVDAYYNRLVAKSLCRIKQSKQLPIFIVVCSTARMLGLFAVLHACIHA